MSKDRLEAFSDGVIAILISALAIYPGGEAAMLIAQALDAEVLALLRRATGA
ncbi:MAG TPA: hypothetical protein VF951_13205 [Streptosporangiaceae bacterium]|nr:hypothetical protein [Gemmatimonadales bacterium]